MSRNLTCIICPRGCSMTAIRKNDVLIVNGNACPRGEKYAISECIHPVRTVTSTVRVSNRKNVMVSVKTAKPVPKNSMIYVVRKLRAMTVEAPVTMGAVIVPDVFGTEVIATQNVE